MQAIIHVDEKAPVVFSHSVFPKGCESDPTPYVSFRLNADGEIDIYTQSPAFLEKFAKELLKAAIELEAAIKKAQHK